MPFIVVINKKDLVDAWRGDGPAIDALSRRSLGVLHASAKTGEGVNEAFQQLADALVPR
jgi:50S ribosomal subunit-associated GTPase HflX